MCIRKENEPWWAYMARWLVEQPRVLLSIVGLVAAGVFYYDLRAYMLEQQEVQAKTVRVLTELSIRLQNIEKRVEKISPALNRAGADAYNGE